MEVDDLGNPFVAAATPTEVHDGDSMGERGPENTVQGGDAVHEARHASFDDAAMAVTSAPPPTGHNALRALDFFETRSTAQNSSASWQFEAGGVPGDFHAQYYPYVQSAFAAIASQHAAVPAQHTAVKGPAEPGSAASSLVEGMRNHDLAAREAALAKGKALPRAEDTAEHGRTLDTLRESLPHRLHVRATLAPAPSGLASNVKPPPKRRGDQGPTTFPHIQKGTRERPYPTFPTPPGYRRQTFPPIAEGLSLLQSAPGASREAHSFRALMEQLSPDDRLSLASSGDSTIQSAILGRESSSEGSARASDGDEPPAPSLVQEAPSSPFQPEKRRKRLMHDEAGDPNLKLVEVEVEIPPATMILVHLICSVCEAHGGAADAPNISAAMSRSMAPLLRAIQKRVLLVFPDYFAIFSARRNDVASLERGHGSRLAAAHLKVDFADDLILYADGIYNLKFSPTIGQMLGDLRVFEKHMPVFDTKYKSWQLRAPNSNKRILGHFKDMPYNDACLERIKGVRYRNDVESCMRFVQTFPWWDMDLKRNLLQHAPSHKKRKVISAAPKPRASPASTATAMAQQGFQPRRPGWPDEMNFPSSANSVPPCEVLGRSYAREENTVSHMQPGDGLSLDGGGKLGGNPISRTASPDMAGALGMAPDGVEPGYEGNGALLAQGEECVPLQAHATHGTSPQGPMTRNLAQFPGFEQCPIQRHEGISHGDEERGTTAHESEQKSADARISGASAGSLRRLIIGDADIGADGCSQDPLKVLRRYLDGLQSPALADDAELNFLNSNLEGNGESSLGLRGSALTERGRYGEADNIEDLETALNAQKLSLWDD